MARARSHVHQPAPNSHGRAGQSQFQGRAAHRAAPHRKIAAHHFPPRSAVSGNETDPVTTNNTATVSVNVTLPVNLSIAKTAPSTGTTNQNLTYTITVTQCQHGVCFAKMSSGSKMAQFSLATAGMRSLHSTQCCCQDPKGFFWAEMWARLRRIYYGWVKDSLDQAAPS